MIIIVTSLTPDLTRIGPDRSVGKFLISLDHEVISCEYIYTLGAYMGMYYELSY